METLRPELTQSEGTVCSAEVSGQSREWQGTQGVGILHLAVIHSFIQHMFIEHLPHAEHLFELLKGNCTSQQNPHVMGLALQMPKQVHQTACDLVMGAEQKNQSGKQDWRVYARACGGGGCCTQWVGEQGEPY